MDPKKLIFRLKRAMSFLCVCLCLLPVSLEVLENLVSDVISIKQVRKISTPLQCFRLLLNENV